jgi:arylsulfatase
MPQDRPNLLFFFTDQQRFDWVGMHPDVPVRTPNLERLTERGVYFENAVCPSPLCGPSRACLASGMEYDDCGMHTHGIDPTFDRDDTHYARLRDDADYSVMGCGKTLDKFYEKRGPNGKHRLREFGMSDGVRNRGKWASAGGVDDPREHVYMRDLDDRGVLETHMNDFDMRSGTRKDHFAATFPTPLSDEEYCDSWLARRGLELIQNTPEQQPWHLEVSFIGPHDPLDVTHEMYEWYRGENAVDFPGPAPMGAGDCFDGRTHNEIRRNYAAMVENIDRWVGEYLDFLEQRGELEDTVVIFSSDHGEMLGDHGRWKKHSPYQSSVGVPMVVAGPGVEARGQVAEPASVLDVHATCLDYAGLDTDDVDSKSLRPFLEGETDDHREYVHSGLGPWRMVFDGRYKLVTGYETDGEGYDLLLGDKDQVNEYEALDDAEQRAVREERPDLLFDLQEDPNETVNVADDYPDVVEELAAELPEV